MKKIYLIATIANILCCGSMLAQCFEEQEFSIAGDYVFEVPSDQSTYMIEIEVRGGDGGNFLWIPNPQTDGGAGATIKASFEIDGGSLLDIFVGQSGMDGPGSPGGGGGGGGSAVVIQSDQVLIAAAGGGGGGQGVTGIGQGGQANTDSAAQGGAAPGASGGGGYNQAGANGAAGSGGGAGTLVGSGIGGEGGITAGDGGSGFGGGGGGSGTGGGGYLGGDGSQAGALAGLGGDSFVTDLFASSVLDTQAGVDGGGTNQDGFVIITCTGAESLDIEVVSVTSPDCSQGFGGQIEVSGVGGTLPYSYSINQGTPTTEGLFSDLSAGDYILTVFDGNGDEATTMVTLEDPETLTVLVSSVTNNICFGALDGSVTVSAEGGTSTSGDYSYSINGSPLQTSPIFEGLASGFVVISVFDDNGCEAQITSMISSPPGIGLFVSGQTDVSCNGEADGTAEIFASGGVGDFIFELDGTDVGPQNVYDDLAAGAHQVVVTDQNGCTEFVSFVLEEPAQLIVDLVVDSTGCAGSMDGSIAIEISGGTPSYIVSFNGDVIDTTFIDSLGAGGYDVMVTDANGCIATQSTGIPELEQIELVVLTTSEASCAGLGSVQLAVINGSGPPVYRIDTIVSSDGAFELPAGVYEASVEIGGCIATTTVAIQQASDLAVSITSVVEPSCPGDSNGQLAVGLSGGTGPFTYMLNDSIVQDSSTFSGLPSGFYTVTIEDSLSCTTMISLMIDDPSMIEMALFIADVGCYGDSSGVIAVDPSNGTGPYMVAIDTSITMTEGELVSQGSLAPGSYAISVMDANGCSVDSMVTLTQNDSIELVIDSLSGVVCNLGTQGYAALSAEGGLGPYQYSLSTGQLGDGLFDNLNPGLYRATVFDSIGCTQDLDFQITAVGSLVVNDAVVTDVACHGEENGMVDIIVNTSVGPVSIFIDSLEYNGTTIGGLAAGSYDVMIRDQAGCEGEIDFIVNEPEELILSIVDFDDGTGTDGFVLVDAEGGTSPYQYAINDTAVLQSEMRFDELPYGPYVIYVIDSNGCVDSVGQVLTSTNDLAQTLGLEIYPNPAHDVIFVEVEDVRSGLTVMLTDIAGRIIQERRLIGTKKTMINISTLEAGTYTVWLSTSERSVVQRVVKL